MTGPVEEMVWCQWEAAHVPVDHHCVGDGAPTPPCPDEAGEPCGRCQPCLAAQEATLTPTPDLREVRKRALTYIREGCVRWVFARPNEDGTRPIEVRAWVHGHKASYRVAGDLRGEEMIWRCDCSRRISVVAVDGQCAHVAAVSLNTGWPSAAGKPEPDTGGGDTQ
jgi:uncharacterized Zn finger protein